MDRTEFAWFESSDMLAVTVGVWCLEGVTIGLLGPVGVTVGLRGTDGVTAAL